MKQIYTGVGSRKTPPEVQTLMTQIAAYLSNQGFTLRSGGASGADRAFEKGASQKEIYLPWRNFNNCQGIYNYSQTSWNQAEQIVKTIHPNWKACSSGVRKLHTRNAFQVLGFQLDSPSDFLICWTEERNGSIQGGTRTAVILAEKSHIPCFNLWRRNEVEKLKVFLKKQLQ